MTSPRFVNKPGTKPYNKPQVTLFNTQWDQRRFVLLALFFGSMVQVNKSTSPTIH